MNNAYLSFLTKGSKSTTSTTGYGNPVLERRGPRQMAIYNNITAETKKLNRGLCMNGVTKTFQQKRPLISVITVVFNNVEHLDKTIQSVSNQTYDNIEYIIIDGGSTDGTLDIIKKHENCIDFWISEPDAGIYDAMNKGIERATGKWAIFMNSGDWFHSANVVQEIFSTLITENIDAIYGRHIVQFGDGLLAPGQVKSIDSFWQGMIASHQSFFVQISILKQIKFNTANKIVADFELLYGLFMNGGSFLSVETIVSCVSAQGLSDANRLRVITANWRVVGSYQSNIFRSMYFIIKLVDTFMRSVIKRVLPRDWIRYVRLFKSRKWHGPVIEKAGTNAK
jgi:glycosyltransferase involved in cell wall biosynthesis